MKTYDVIVIGVGTMGAAACYHLAKRGEAVLGLEQHAIPHSLGSHHGFSRMIRLAYYEHPDYVPLLQRAYDLWDALEAETNAKLLHRTGGLYIGLRGQPFLEGALTSAKRHGLDHETLTHREIEKCYPMFSVPETHEGFFEKMAGFLVPESVMGAHVTQALHHGAELRGHVKVSHWEADRENGVIVRTGDGEALRARRLVITAGPWTSQILTDLQLGLTVTRQTWGWFWPEHPEHFTLGTFPSWFYETPGGGHYGFPMMPDNPGFKLACHVPSNILTAPDEVDRTITRDDESAFRPFLRRHIPQANGNLLAIRTCLYTNSPDAHFIIDRHPQFRHVIFACGFSGHGFKFAGVMGEVLADLAVHGRTEHPIGFLSLKRFR